MSSEETNFEAELRSLLANGRKIEAIKRYREQTGAGLAEAKDAVEAMERGETLPAGDSSEPDLEREVVSLLEQGKKIEAIKLYRKRTGLGFVEAKDAVEAIAAERHIVVPSGSGCFGVLVFILASVVVVALITCWLEAVIDGLGASRVGTQRFFDGPPTQQFGYDDSVVYRLSCTRVKGLPPEIGLHIRCQDLPVTG